MIPPADVSILQSNPQFAHLHKHLTTQLLNPDGSTCATSEEHASVSKAVHVQLLRASKEELLRSSLRNIAASSEEDGDGDVLKLPPELRHLVGTISMLVDEGPSTNPSQEDYDLFTADINAFHDQLTDIAGAVSQDLQVQHDLLYKIVVATSPCPAPPIKHAANSKRILLKNSSTANSSLPTLLKQQQLLLLSSTPNPTLQSSLAALANTTRHHASLHRTLLTTTLTRLERTIHGLHARHTKARSAHLRCVATALAKRIEVVYLQSRNRVYSVDVQEALGKYQSYLEGVERGLGEKGAVLRGVLEEYEDVRVGGGGEEGPRGAMREVGRRYGELLAAIEGVKEEIGELESAGDGLLAT